LLRVLRRREQTPERFHQNPFEMTGFTIEPIEARAPDDRHDDWPPSE